MKRKRKLLWLFIIVVLTIYVGLGVVAYFKHLKGTLFVESKPENCWTYCVERQPLHTHIREVGVIQDECACWYMELPRKDLK